MEASNAGFLEDTLSESVRSLVKTSTVAKEDIKWNEDAFFKRQDLAKASESLFLPPAVESPIGTNLATPRSAVQKFKLPLNLSFTSDGANSSLGILHVENYDLSDSSFQGPIKLKKNIKAKKTLQRSSKVDYQENKELSEKNEEKYFSESPEVNWDIKLSSEADDECDSGSDIEYDGTNIPELNLDCDVLSLLSSTKKAGSFDGTSSNDSYEVKTPGTNLTETISKEINDSASCYLSPPLTEDESLKTDTTHGESSNSTRQSIFENFQPLYNSLYDQIVSGKESMGEKEMGMPQTIKVCPFLGMSSFEVEPILSKPSQPNAYSDVENTRCSQNLSLEFRPEQISARSSSFKSSRQFESPVSSSGLSTNFSEIEVGSQSHFLHQYQQSEQEDLENEALGGSQFQISNYKFQSLFEDEKSREEKDSGLSAESADIEKSAGDLSRKLSEFGNFAFPPDLQLKNLSGFGTEGGDWCSRLGLSESDFFSSDAAKELLKKEKEEFEKNQMTPPTSNKTSSVSNWSLTNQHEVTAPSWLTGISPDTKDAGGRQVSIGTLIGARSENVGTLSEDSERERPYFGKVVMTPPKNRPSDADPYKTSMGSDSADNSARKLRISSLSALLEDISTNDPMEFASQLVKKCSAAFQSESKTRSNDHAAISNKADFEQKDPCKDRRCALSDIEESDDSTFVKSASASNSSKQSDIDMNSESKTATPEPALCNDSSLNFSVDSSSERGSIKSTKSDTCSNCSSAQAMQQKYSWPTPCSSACSIPLAMNNALCLQYGGSMNHLNLCTNGCQNCLHNLMHPGGNSEVPCPHVSCAHPSLKHNMMSASAPSLPSFLQRALSAPLLMTGPSTPYLEIQVVPELHFPEKISVGDTREMNLSIRNSNSVGCCYQINSVSAYLNESPVPCEMSGLNCNKIVSSTVGGVADTTLVLAPRYSGKVVVNMQIDAFLSSIGQTLNATPVSIAKTKIQYEAVDPSITMLSRGKDTLNLGQVVVGSTFVEYITVTNNCDVSVPLRISLSNNVSAENQIYFGLREMNRQQHPSLGTLRVLSPEVLLYRIPATENRSLPSSFEIPIVFASINGRVDSTVTAAIETPAFRKDLALIKISASSGDAKLVLQDPSQNPLVLQAPVGASCKYSLSLMNTGSLCIVYDIHIEGDNVFSVSPNSLSLQPKQCASISVNFSPTTYQTVKGYLLAAAEPHGQVCTVTEVIGQVKENPTKLQQNLGLSSQVSRNTPKPPKGFNPESACLISCNKKFLDWSGVDIDACKVKTCTIKNCKDEQLHIKIYIRDSNQVFLLIDDSGRQTSMFDVILKAGEEKAISVAFTPKSISLYSAFLGIIVILPENRNQSNYPPKERTKFSMQLNGYGGTSNIKVLDLPNAEATGYCLEVDASEAADVAYKNFIIQNVGCRPAFVKLLLSYSIVQNFAGRQSVIHPSEFVLLENEKKNILLSINCSNKNVLTSNEAISVIYGDEIMRQRLRRMLSSSKNQSINCNIDFNVPYDGEEKVPHDNLYKSFPREGDLFNSHLKKFLIHISFINGQNSTFSSLSFAPLSECQDSFSDITLNSTLRRLTLEDRSPSTKHSASFMNRPSLPIALDANSFDPGVPDSSVASISDCLRSLIIDSWSVQPEELIIDAEIQEKRILLKSHSDSDLRFKVEWNINVITISPITGILSANKEIGLRLTLIHTNHNKLLDDYAGFIKIVCDKTEKHVHVKVCRDLNWRKTRAVSPVPSNLSDTLRSGILDDSSLMDATLVEPVSSVINVDNIFCFPKVIDLQKTRQGDISETVLTVCNPTEKTVTWNVRPSTMLFSQPFDDSLDATSSAIVFYESNGTLHPSEKEKIVIKFLPFSVAHFSQFFELVLSSEYGEKQTCTIKVQGEAVVDFLTTLQGRNFEKDTKQAGSRKKGKSRSIS